MEPVGSGIPSRGRRDPDRKARILEAAGALIVRSGYHRVAMADIGAVGIVGSGIYRHFDSKAAILAALLQEVLDELERSVRSSATTSRSP
ncbi:TetR/AcrR family transcriptional regulator [Pseudonocardia oceani]|uniref:TetR/AcrR family transcriptional regulator n=1 Tax=Pseudonocardia oceani TaxID=2792013 RepID=UPI001CED9F8E|nr:TetR/AcrR family transcriptional regulator [Pseudonocardia oceani]